MDRSTSGDRQRGDIALDASRSPPRAWPAMPARARAAQAADLGRRSRPRARRVGAGRGDRIDRLRSSSTAAARRPREWRGQERHAALRAARRAGVAWVSIDYRLTPDGPPTHSSTTCAARSRSCAITRPARRVSRTSSWSASLRAARWPRSSRQKRWRVDGGVVVAFYGVYDFTALMVGRRQGPRLAARPPARSARLDQETWRGCATPHQSLTSHLECRPCCWFTARQRGCGTRRSRTSARLADAGVKFEVVRLDGAPHGMENGVRAARVDRCVRRAVGFVRHVHPPGKP